MILELSVLGAALGVIALILGYTLVTGAPPTPTSPKVKAAMLSLLPEDVEGAIFELGSGWGTLAFPLARRYPRTRVAAYELSPVPWAFARARHMLTSLPNLEILRADYHTAPLGEAGLVVVYIHRPAMVKLKAKLEAELRPGAVVLSNFFSIPGWTPQKETTAGDLYRSKVFLYRVE